MRSRWMVLFLATVVAVASAAPADAQSQEEWQFQLAPLYLWAVNLDGTMTVRDVLDRDFEVDFKDAFSNLEMAFTVHFEARKGRWGLLADVSYLSFSGTQDIDTPGRTADIEVENLLLEGAAGYEFSDQWWVIAGVRYFKLDTDIAFAIRPPIEPSESWADLFAGIMWRPQLGERWRFSGRFDIGAGGSDLVWNAAALLDYRLGKWAAVFFGYRHLDYDYKNQNTGIKFDVSMSGPVAAFRFFW